MTELDFTLLSAGYCEASESHTLRGRTRKKIKFFATFGLLVHEHLGVILFDTGYTSRFYDYTSNFPFTLYAKLTKVFISKENQASEVLKRKGIKPETVKFIIISHFHADHIGGLRDFPNAKFISSKRAWLDIKNKTGFSALRKGFLPGLLPEDFEERIILLDFSESNQTDPLLGRMVDVFEDASIFACELEGHAAGQIGILFNSDTTRYFLVADGAWSWRNYQMMHLPSPTVRLFFDSWSNFKSTLVKIHKYHLDHPETIIIPCHCEDTYLKYGE